MGYINPTLSSSCENREINSVGIAKVSLNHILGATKTLLTLYFPVKFYVKNNLELFSSSCLRKNSFWDNFSSLCFDFSTF